MKKRKIEGTVEGRYSFKQHEHSYKFTRVKLGVGEEHYAVCKTCGDVR
jgi:hypothetical protein